MNEARSLVSDVEFTETLHLTRNTIEDMGTRIPAWLEQLGASREEDEISGNSIRLTIEGGAEFTATLVENSSTQALKTETEFFMTLEEFKDYVRTGKPLDTEEIHQLMDKMSGEARKITFRLNAAYRTPEEVRDILSELFGYRVPDNNKP